MSMIDFIKVFIISVLQQGMPFFVIIFILGCIIAGICIFAKICEYIFQPNTNIPHRLPIIDVTNLDEDFQNFAILNAWSNSHHLRFTDQERLSIILTYRTIESQNAYQEATNRLNLVLLFLTIGIIVIAVEQLFFGERNYIYQLLASNATQTHPEIVSQVISTDGVIFVAILVFLAILFFTSLYVLMRQRN